MEIEEILVQIRKIIKKYEELKSTFTPLKHFGSTVKDEEERARINKIITEVKLLVLDGYGKNSELYKQIKSHSKRIGRPQLELIISDIKGLYEHLKSYLDDNNKEQDLAELLAQPMNENILPDSVNYNKYNGIFDQLKLPNIMFQLIFVCENILRLFLIQILNENSYSSVMKIAIRKLTNKIEKRKSEEENQNYLPIRGDHDIYYLDLIDLKKIIIHLWSSCFEDKFQDQTWIISRINSLYIIRNRVAHNSGFLTKDELKSVETYSREIIKQIDKFIVN